MKEKKQVEELVSILDSFMKKGGSHVNVDAVGKAKKYEIKIQNNSCSGGKFATACAVPNLMKGLDTDSPDD